MARDPLGKTHVARRTGRPALHTGRLAQTSAAHSHVTSHTTTTTRCETDIKAVAAARARQSPVLSETSDVPYICYMRPVSLAL